ncbi:hypothetical protein SPRG_07345 [Saprolegnia parasitica CBS 223.65]|uniref:ER membrane protein complex subunit 3 n=1 Tax=Saprolegnia parasitica (strain CBS 223.65) TaxID=695850 RepID=A0A067CLQ8_SAPPC|nr:hypothetical protein SPRG_07345 [Saprolegnia parasitica CBS 223.65]KDO27717.1 hypothetical protein SPRG_07345 [Saprolegnia parasitica CBS 223.65]|eukprot:XP_012201522.1 hypothetical protein SPRG_07345 [Saprolegnia parasitica CBS 223.65]
MGDLILDPSIRDWVIVPMIILFVCSAMIRNYVSVLLKTDEAGELEELRKINTVKRAAMLRMNCHYITRSAFSMRKFYFTASEKNDGVQGALREKVKNDAMNQMMNPNSMMKMMKGNMTFMVSNFVMMGLMGYFFGGFVLVKVPFSLTQRFKAMLQRGIEMTTLDVSYVSSVSLYFLIMFGMSGFMSLILGSGSMNDDARAMQMQMGMGVGAGPGFDAPRVYKQERVNLRLHVHEYALEHAEKKLLGDDIPKKVEAPAPVVSDAAASKRRRQRQP